MYKYKLVAYKYQFFTQNQKDFVKKVFSNFEKWQILASFENKIDFSINWHSGQLVAVKSSF